MGFIDTIKAKAKADLKTIVLPESEDDRTLKAAETVVKEGFALPIILVAEADVKASAERLGVSLEGVKILDNTKSEDIDRYATLLAEIRAKKGMTFDQAKEILLSDRLTFGILMVKAGDADGLVSGACHTSADMLRPALQIIKTAPGRKVASIAFIFELPTPEFGENGILLCADCALMQDPNPEELAEIGAESAASFEALVAPEARVAFLCHSTKGSAKHPFVDKVTSAVAIAKEKYPDVPLQARLTSSSSLTLRQATSATSSSSVSARPTLTASSRASQLP